MINLLIKRGLFPPYIRVATTYTFSSLIPFLYANCWSLIPKAWPIFVPDPTNMVQSDPWFLKKTADLDPMVCDPWCQGSDPRSHPPDPWSHIPPWFWVERAWERSQGLKNTLPNMKPDKVLDHVNRGGGGGGTGGLSLPLPVPFNPGSRPVFVGSRLFVFFRLRNIAQCWVVLLLFSRFPQPWESHFPPRLLLPPLPRTPPTLFTSGLPPPCPRPQ